LQADLIRSDVGRLNVNAIEELRACCGRDGSIVFLEQIWIDQPVGRRESCARDTFEAIDFGHPPIHLGRRQRLNRMAKCALHFEAIAGLGPGLGVVQPQITLLAKAYFVADTLVVTNRLAAEGDIDRLPPRRTHPAGVLLARTEASTEVDIRDRNAQCTLRQPHRD